MEHIRGFLDRIVKKAGIGKRSEDEFIFENWKSIAAGTAAEDAEPYKLKNRVLYAFASSSAAMNELTYQKKAIIIRINALLRGERVKDIVFRIKQ